MYNYKTRRFIHIALLILLPVITVLSAYLFVVNGTLVITSVPTGANVYLNKKLIGVTPIRVKVHSDKCEIEIVKKGYEKYLKDVVINKLGSTAISANLSKLGYLLVVSQYPSWAGNAFYEMDSDGNIVKKIGRTFKNSSFVSAFISKESDKIVFVLKEEKGIYSLWESDTDGSNAVKIASFQIPVEGIYEFPGGGKFLICSRKCTDSLCKKGIMYFTVADAKNKSVKLIKKIKYENREEIADYEEFSISPDGKKIIFFRCGYRTLRNSDLWIMDSSGDMLKNLTSKIKGAVVYASFFHSKKKLLFSIFGGTDNIKYTGLYIVDDDGQNMNEILKENFAVHPQISDDDRFIYFISNANLWRYDIKYKVKKILAKNAVKFWMNKIKGKVVYLDFRSDLRSMNSDGSQNRLIARNLFGSPFTMKGGPICSCGSNSEIEFPTIQTTNNCFSRNGDRMIVSFKLNQKWCVVNLINGKVTFPNLGLNKERTSTYYKYAMIYARYAPIGWLSP